MASKFDDPSVPVLRLPNETRRAERGRSLRAKSYEDTWLDEFLQGMFGSENAGGSVLDPNREGRVAGNRAGQVVGLATDALDLPKAGLMAVPALAGILGGGANKYKMQAATNLFQRGRSQEEILADTGLGLVPTAPGRATWGVQIHDSGARIDPMQLQKIDSVSGLPLGAILDHPKLYAQYPTIADVPVKQVSGLNAMQGVQGSFHPSEGVTMRKLNSFLDPSTVPEQLDDRTAVLLHELQHAMQFAYGWPRGGSPAEFALQSTNRANALGAKKARQLEEIVDDLLKQNGIPKQYVPALMGETSRLAKDPNAFRLYSDPDFVEGTNLIQSYPRLVSDWDRLQHLYGRVKGRKEQELGSYMSLAGEAQSRSAEKAFKAKAPPHIPQTSYYDIPLERLLYK